MLRTLQQRNTMVKIVLAAILGIICISMVITLGVGNVGSIGNSPDTVARVGAENISQTDVRQMLARVSRNQSIPPMLRGLYTRQIIDQMIFQKSLEYEADRLGIRVTPEEQANRIKQILPTVFTGDTWVGKDRYAGEVQLRTGMSVPEFEDYLRQSLLEEKFRNLVTDGIRVTPAEVEREFRRRNEKVSIEYALIKPEDLAPTINPSDAELNAYFSKNQSKYQVPERRSARYALLDLNQLREKTQIPEADLRAYYNQHLDRYKVQNRVHVEHILFKTISKTDAEVAEIQKKAEDLLKQAKKGQNFEDLAKKYSEDTTKDKGGDLGWIVEGQTVPAFEHAAFSLPKGSVSDLVKTPYGFHIIKVLDRETAHVQGFEEVRSQILPTLLDEKVNELSNNISTQMASVVRQSNRQSIEDIAKKFNLQLGETPPVSVTDPVGNLGNSPDLHQILFQLRPGELSPPQRVDTGYVVLTVKDIQPAHQATLAEVREKVLADYRGEKSVELARSRADELAKRVQSGEPLAKAAKGLGLEAKTSDPFPRTGNVGDLGPAKPFEPAFAMSVGQASPATPIQGNWIVYRIASHENVNPDDLAKQRQSIEQQLLQSKQSAAFDAFREALEARLRKEGKLVMNAEAVKRLTSST
ncbi:MAG: peptidyl-prolyl cis-trans isomerase [Candidatus Acidiferrales bacterium]